ncbi:hypothetical protein FS842_001976 [Serendipita sp. 407]|nr:hypothetical protein FS842_001976 [Serendipita sp. 407]
MGNTHPVGGRSSGDNGVSTTNQMIQTSRGRVSGPSTSRPSRNADGIKTCSDLASSEPPDTTAQVQDILKRAAESKSPQFLDKNEATHAGKPENNIESDAVQSQGKGVPNAEWEVEDLAVRSITFWRTGFTVGDGHLRLYGDPESNKILQSIQEGTAPTDLFNVRIGQPVELRVHKRLDEDYVSPPPESLSEARDLSGDSVLSQRPLSRRHLPDE